MKEATPPEKERRPQGELEKQDVIQEQIQPSPSCPALVPALRMIMLI
jgi:hypothetical protein